MIGSLAVPLNAIPMTVQGSVTGTEGAMPPSGSGVTFRFYSAATGEWPWWKGEGSLTWISPARYSAKLSNIDTLFYYGTSLYLSTEFASGGELAERIPLLAVPYAFKSNFAGSVGQGLTMLANLNGEVRIQVDGFNNVGVRTITPSTTLDVADGPMRVTGGIYRQITSMSVGNGTVNPQVNWSSSAIYQLNFNLTSAAIVSIGFSAPPTHPCELTLLLYNSNPSPGLGSTLVFSENVKWTTTIGPSMPSGKGYTLIKLYYTGSAYVGSYVNDLLQ